MKKVLFIITFVISALGVNAAEFHTDSTFDTKSLLANVKKHIRPGDTVLVKASHFMGFDSVVKELEEF